MGTTVEAGVGIGTAEWEVKVRQWCVEQALKIRGFDNADEILGEADELRVWVSKRADEQKKPPADTLNRCPLQIEIMLACQWSPDIKSHFGPRFNTEGFMQELDQLIQHGLVILDTLKPTDRGHRWIEAILHTPLPKSHVPQYTVVSTAAAMSADEWRAYCRRYDNAGGFGDQRSREEPPTG